MRHAGRQRRGSWRRVAVLVALVMMPLVLALSAACSSAPEPDAPTVDPEHRADVEAWRDEREARLRSETGWLTLVGLHWLEPGDNAFGSAPGVPVRLPADRAEARVGVFRLTDDGVTVITEESAGVTLEGHPVSELALRADADEDSPDVLYLGSLRLQVIRRGERFGIRVKDTDSETLRSFSGMDYFPVRTDLRVLARWEPYSAPQPRDVPTVTGIASRMLAPGRAFFTVEDREVSLEPVISSSDDDELFFIFSDATSGNETYGAGRFLYTGLPENGKLAMDFNKAYNPPCVFTPYATCPLPPPGNALNVPIEAGEKNWGAH